MANPESNNITKGKNFENATKLGKQNFYNSGTTAVEAKRLKRQYVGFDVNFEYVKLARKRIGI